MNILIVGTGAIARALERLLKKEEPDCSIRFVSSRDSFASYLNSLSGVDAVAITISTKDDGQAAAEYIMNAVRRNIPVVTCEKGSLSQYFYLLAPHLKKIGYSATVGAGNGMLKLLEKRNDIVSITGIVNGSLNNISTIVERGGRFKRAVCETRRAGYTDPSVRTFAGIINGELRDACRKAVILHNLLCPKTPVSDDLVGRMVYYLDGVYPFFARKYDKWLGRRWDAPNRRLIVQIFPYELVRAQRVYIGSEPCFWLRGETHYIAGSFIDPSWIFPMTPRGIENCLQVEYRDGKKGFHYGPGAGVDQTAAALLSDLRLLIAHKKEKVLQAA